MQRRPTEPRRHGFTLAEMLMAVAIILILVAIGAFAVLRLRDTGPYQATVANMNKIKQALDTQWKAVVDKASHRADPARLPWQQGRSDDAAKIHQRPAEAVVSDQLRRGEKLGKRCPGLGGYVKYLTNPPSANPAQQNAICLLMILERGPNAGQVTQDQLGTTGALLLAGTLYGCVDAWGNPLQFSRGANGFEIRSAGVDAQFGTEDDISSNKDL